MKAITGRTLMWIFSILLGLALIAIVGMYAWNLLISFNHAAEASCAQSISTSLQHSMRITGEHQFINEDSSARSLSIEEINSVIDTAGAQEYLDCGEGAYRKMDTLNRYRFSILVTDGDARVFIEEK